MDAIVRNINLAPQGAAKIDWVKAHMPVLNTMAGELAPVQPLKGRRLVMTMHLEAKTAYLALVLKQAGAQVAVTGSNPLSTQDDVAAALVQEGIRVYAWYNTTPEEYTGFLHQALDIRPELIIDDGGDLVSLLHGERRELAGNIIGGSEETTTGVMRLRTLEKEGKLLFPMMAVNDAFCKYLFDNRYGTGQSTWDGIMRATNLTIASKTVVVAGYGWCGKGVAMRAKGLGANVIVCEVDPIKAAEALFDGFQVMSMAEAAERGDIFVTVTGCRDAIRKEHFAVMKSGAILANAGHFDVEINKPDLAALAVSRRIVRKNIEEFQFADGRKVYLLAEGRLVNLAAGDGHPTEIMDLSFALQAQAVLYLLEQQGRLANRVHTVPYTIDQRVAALKLKAMGITIDTLTPAQQAYLHSS